MYVKDPDHSAALSIRMTRLKPRGPPRTGAHQKQAPVQHLRGGGGGYRGAQISSKLRGPPMG